MLTVDHVHQGVPQLLIRIVAVAAGAAWALAFISCLLAADASARLAARRARETVEHARPALLNLVTTRCRLDGAAYAAAIIGLAARGFFEVSQPEPGKLWCRLPPAPGQQPGPAPPESADATGLAGSERIVLEHARMQAGDGGAPFEALAESCTADVRGIWEPFEAAVRAEGRQAGLTRRRLPAGAGVPFVLAGTVVAGLAFLAFHHPHGGLASPVAAAVVTVGVVGFTVAAAFMQDRLTPAGAALAARAGRAAGPALSGVPETLAADYLNALAVAVAAGLPVRFAGAVPGSHTGVRPGGRRTAARSPVSPTGRPKAAWSSYGGQWRLVPIGDLAGQPWLRAGGLLAIGAWIGVIGFATSLIGPPTGAIVSSALYLAAAATGATGAITLVQWLGQPTDASFGAQVIARWVEDQSQGDNDTVRVPCLAFDDGARAWVYGVDQRVFSALAIGDVVRLRISPRSHRLKELRPDQSRPQAMTPPARDATPGPYGGFGQRASFLTGGGKPLSAADTLLGPGEVLELLGGPAEITWVRTRLSLSVLYRGDKTTLSVTVAGRRLGKASSVPAQRAGRPVGGIGDEAWILNSGRTIVARAGGQTVKLTLSGRNSRDRLHLLPSLAALAAHRLAARNS